MDLSASWQLRAGERVCFPSPTAAAAGVETPAAVAAHSTTSEGPGSSMSAATPAAGAATEVPATAAAHISWWLTPGQ
jgi:hypothetical protein